VTIESSVAEPVKKKVHIAAKKPRLGDVISTQFVISKEGEQPITYSAELPPNSGIYVASGPEHTQTVQLVEKRNSGFVISMSGSPYKITVWSERMDELFGYMPKKTADDHSNELIAPMPGKVHSIAVSGILTLPREANTLP